MTSSLENCLQAIRADIQALRAYHVADASGLIKLDAMENPYVLSGDLRRELQARLGQAELNRYPDPSAASLREKLRRVMQVPSGKAIVLGNGSDELIQMLAMAVSGGQQEEGGGLLSFEPGFVMYRMIAQFTGVDYTGMALNEDFSLDMAALRKAIEQRRPAIVFIAYPNNPSANCYAREQIEEIIAMAPGMVVLDEAYHPFAQASFMPDLERYDNLLVMRTVSKMGLAGLRLGLLCGHPDIIEQIDKIRLPYNINVLTQVAAEFVLDNVDELDKQAALIREQREDLLAKMQAMPEIKTFPSDANFILFRILDKSADEIFDAIKAQGVLIKNMKAKDGLLANCLRVTVGTPEENGAFFSALKNAVNSE